MSQTLPSGVKLFDSNDTVTRAAFNENWQTIGNHISGTGTPHANAIPGGAAGFMSGADKAALDSNTDQLTFKPSTSVTLKPGLNVITSPTASRLRNLTIQGRTLVNLLGRDGNFGQLASGYWTSFAGTATTDGTTATLIGDGSATNPQLNLWRIQSLTPPALGDRFFIRVKASSSSTLASLRVYLWSAVTSLVDNIGRVDSPVAGVEYDVYAVVTVTQPIIDNWANFRFVVAGYFPTAAASSGVALKFRQAAMYKLPAADYALTPSELNTKYPYVDDIKHVNAVYVRNSGKNLLPPLAEWIMDSGATILSPYSFTQTYIAGTAAQSGIRINVKEGQSYKISLNNPNGVRISGFWEDSAGTNLGYFSQFTGNLSGVLTAPPSAVRLKVAIDNNNLAGTVTVADLMLHLGSNALPFEPQKPSYMYLPDVQLRSNTDGSVADRLYMDGEGKPRAVRRFKEVTLDGALSWTFLQDYTGYKAVFALGLATDVAYGAYFRSVKYDGKVLGFPYTSIADGIGVDGSNGATIISIADTDSGWGESYTPTADEVKAYFNGWVMSNNFSGAYNGTGTKAWEKRYCGQGVKRDNNGNPVVNGSGVLTVPTTVNDMGWTPYRLFYQLAAPTDEPVNYEGDLMLHDGTNQVEVGAGIIVREVMKPEYSSGSVAWFGNVGAPGKFRQRVLSPVLRTYKNGGVDATWKHVAIGASFVTIYGYYGVSTTVYDSSATYSVTYLALDVHTIGHATTSFTAEYSPNATTEVNHLVDAVKSARGELSVQRNTLAVQQKDMDVHKTTTNTAINDSTLLYWMGV